MQKINSSSFGDPSELTGSGIPEAEEHRRECLSGNNGDLKRANIMGVYDNENALAGGYGAYSEDSGYDIYEGKVLGGDTEAGGVSTFVEIPMAGEDKGRNIQIRGSQVPMGKDEAIKTPVHGSGTQRNEVSDGGIGIRSAEVVIQTGGLNLLVYRGVQEATLRTVMKVVMGHA